MIDRVTNVLKSMLITISSLRHKSIDIRSIMFFGGLAILWHGINSSPVPWLSYVVVGIILMIVGWLSQEDS